MDELRAILLGQLAASSRSLPSENLPMIHPIEVIDDSSNITLMQAILAQLIF